MGSMNWGDDSDSMKATSTAGKTAGVNIGGAIGAVAGGLFYFLGYIWMMQDAGRESFRIPLFPILGFGLVGFIIGAFIGGLLGNIYDKMKDKQNGI